MTKIFKSLSIIAFVAAIALAGTGAYFSDTETSTRNVFTAGKLDLEIDQVTPGPVVSIPDMKPCDVHYSDPITLRVIDNPGRIYKHIKNVNCTTGVDINDVTEPECTEQNGVWTYNSTNDKWYCDWKGNTDQNNINEYTWFDLLVWRSSKNIDPIPFTPALICDDSAVPDDDDCWYEKIPEEIGKGVDDFTSCWIPLGLYSPSASGVPYDVTIIQSFHLDKDVTNWAQSDSCIFEEEFMLVQENDTRRPVTTERRTWDPTNMICVDCTATPETLCADGIDNDCDGLVDCADPDCAGASNCQ